MRLRPIERADLERVRELRNANREWFFDSHEVSVEQHEQWFEGLAAKPIRFYVIEHEGEVVGTISVTDAGGESEIGNLTLDEAHRGRGLMTKALAELTAAPGRYFAVVVPDNERSLAVFHRANFRDSYVRVERVVEP